MVTDVVAGMCWKSQILEWAISRIPTPGVQNLATRVLFCSCALGMPIWAHAPRVPNNNNNNNNNNNMVTEGQN